MTYTPFHESWEDLPSRDTPITAEALDHIEAGIAAVEDLYVPASGDDVEGKNAKFETTEISNEISDSYMAIRNHAYTGDDGTRVHIEPRERDSIGGALKIFGDPFTEVDGDLQSYRDIVIAFLAAQQGDMGQHGTGVFWIEAKSNDADVPNFGYLGRSPDIGFSFQDGQFTAGRFVRMPTCHTVGITNASHVATDPLITADYKGKRIETVGLYSGTGIPADTFIGTVTPGVGFLLSSSATSQVNVNATATLTTTCFIGLPVARSLFIVGEGPANLAHLSQTMVAEFHGDVGYGPPHPIVNVTDGVIVNGDTTVTSASWALTDDDIGKQVDAEGIPPTARVNTINSPTSMELTLPATADATGVSITLGYEDRSHRWFTLAGNIRNALTMHPDGLSVSPDGVQALDVKDGGSVTIGPLEANDADATTGYLELPTSVGSPTETPVFSTAKAPLTIEDTASPKLWVYLPDQAEWRQVSLAAADASSVPARITDETVTTVAHANTMSESTLVTLASPTGLATRDRLFVRLSGDMLNNTGGAVTFQFRFKIGGTTPLLSNALSVATGASRRRWAAEFWIAIGATTSAQVLTGPGISLGSSGAQSMQFGTPLATSPVYATCAEDMSTTKALVFTVQMGTADANADCRLHTASIEHVPFSA